MDGESPNGRYLARARLPSNSGYKSVELRLRQLSVAGDGSRLLMEVALRGEMFERGSSRLHDLVTDFEWVFAQLVVSAEALTELHARVRRSVEQLEPCVVSLGVGECVLDIELGEEDETAARRGLSAVTVVCGVAASQAECSLSVDSSCLHEQAEGLERMLALLG